jgi:hypothetical protein
MCAKLQAMENKRTDVRSSGVGCVALGYDEKSSCQQDQDCFPGRGEKF